MKKSLVEKHRQRNFSFKMKETELIFQCCRVLFIDEALLFIEQNHQSIEISTLTFRFQGSFSNDVVIIHQ